MHKNPTKFFFGGYVTFKKNTGTVWPLTHEKARASTIHHSQNQPYPNVGEQDHIDERSNPTSQPTYFTTNSVDCAILKVVAF